jgi:hypothetical protein
VRDIATVAVGMALLADEQYLHVPQVRPQLVVLAGYLAAEEIGQPSVPLLVGSSDLVRDKTTSFVLLVVHHLTSCSSTLRGPAYCTIDNVAPFLSLHAHLDTFSYLELLSASSASRHTTYTLLPTHQKLRVDPLPLPPAGVIFCMKFCMPTANCASGSNVGCTRRTIRFNSSANFSMSISSPTS